MKFSDVVQGARAERPLEIPRLNGEAPLRFAVRPLDDGEELDVLAGAREVAKAGGVNVDLPAHVVDPLYTRGLMQHTLLRACLDVDSPRAAREPYFGSIEEVRKLHRDEIAMVFEHLETYQDEVSPLRRKMGLDQLLAKAMQIAEADDDRPFVECSPYLRWTLLRVLAVAHFKPQGLKSAFTSPTEGTTSTPIPSPAAQEKGAQPPMTRAERRAMQRTRKPSSTRS